MKNTIHIKIQELNGLEILSHWRVIKCPNLTLRQRFTMTQWKSEIMRMVPMFYSSIKEN